jgi:hypothetical protein
LDRGADGGTLGVPRNDYYLDGIAGAPQRAQQRDAVPARETEIKQHEIRAQHRV